MKRYAYITLVLIIFVSPLWTATVDLSLKNSRLEGNKFLFDIFLQRTDDWGAGLGHADYYFSYNAAAFSGSPTLTNVHPSIKNYPSVYQLTTKFTGGFLQVKLVFQSGTAWQPGLNLSEQVCTVNLTIADDQQDSDVQWEVLNTGLLTSTGGALTETFIGNGDIALPVELSLFQATFIDEYVELSWRTESEVNNLGFNLFRGNSASGPFVKINGTLIKGAGFSTSPRDYHFQDRRVEPNTTYYYQLEDVDLLGVNRLHPSVISVKTSTAPVMVINDYDLEQNYPNPFNPQTTIRFILKEEEMIDLAVYDLNGHLVKNLLSAVVTAGTHSVIWNGADEQQQLVASGTYFCKLVLPGFYLARKMTLIR